LCSSTTPAPLPANAPAIPIALLPASPAPNPALFY